MTAALTREQAIDRAEAAIRDRLKMEIESKLKQAGDDEEVVLEASGDGIPRVTIIKKVHRPVIGLVDAKIAHWARAAYHSSLAKAAERKQEPTKGPVLLPVEKQNIGRNDPCPCSSGKKFKKCHLNIKVERGTGKIRDLNKRGSNVGRTAPQVSSQDVQGSGRPDEGSGVAVEIRQDGEGATHHPIHGTERMREDNAGESAQE